MFLSAAVVKGVSPLVYLLFKYAPFCMPEFTKSMLLAMIPSYKVWSAFSDAVAQPAQTSIPNMIYEKKLRNPFSDFFLHKNYRRLYCIKPAVNFWLIFTHEDAAFALLQRYWK